jgi:hypothetical protein
MKVKDLKRLLSQIPEDMTLREWNEMNVLIPVTMEFDGRFISPCVEETGMGGTWDGRRYACNRKVFCDCSLWIF